MGYKVESKTIRTVQVGYTKGTQGHGLTLGDLRKFVTDSYAADISESALVSGTTNQNSQISGLTCREERVED